ncbi:MAG: hypothetical protein WBN85_08850 [Candidatus Macondimonas sp.]
MCWPTPRPVFDEQRIAFDHASWPRILSIAARVARDPPESAGNEYLLMEALNKSILDFSAPAIGKAWFSDGSQNQQLAAADFGSTSLRCGKR